MLNKTRKLLDVLNNNGVTYCHWKSNLSLAEALAGCTDIDLLVLRKDASLFRAILGELDFKPAASADSDFPSMEHYFSLDYESGVLIHVHAYYRAITGESLAKNYRFPIEEMLLQNTRQVDAVRVPVKSAELVVLTLRMMLKHTSLVELILLARDWKKVQQEVAWLLEAGPIDDSIKLLKEWLPSLEAALFTQCVDALKTPAPFYQRLILGWRLRSRLSNYARHSTLIVWLSGWRKFSAMLFRRLTRLPKGMMLHSGGAVIAFVGPEATGKSTLLAEIKHWLGEHFVVYQIHAGKPKSTPLTFLPNLLVPALRLMLPGSRSSQVETRYSSKEPVEKSQAIFPLLFAIRSVLLAHDRRALLTGAYSRSANGGIVLCDRYPSMCSGVPDSPQLLEYQISKERYPIGHLLVQTEKRLYREIPSPDLIISLHVPVEVAIMRNKTRGKEEPEDYVRLRHAQSSDLKFTKTTVYRINTDQAIDKTILEVKKAIWLAL